MIYFLETVFNVFLKEIHLNFFSDAWVLGKGIEKNLQNGSKKGFAPNFFTVYVQ